MSDCLEQVGLLLDAFLPEGDFVPSEQAAKFVAHLEETNPELLHEWERVTVVSNLRQTLAARIASQRARWRHSAERSVFANAVEEHEGGDSSSLESFVSPFSVYHRVSEDNVQRRVADMTGSDHIFVAESYERKGNYVLMLGAFHREVGKQCGDRPTSDVMSEDEYLRLYQSIVGRAA